MRQVTNETLTAEELDALDEDLDQLIDDAQTAVTVTYHSMGTESVNTETGAVTETGGVDVASVKAVRLDPVREQNEQFDIQHATDVFLIRAADLAAVTPKLNDYIVLSTVKKYIKFIVKPIPFIHYRFICGEQGGA